MPNEKFSDEVNAWHQEQRNQWETSNAKLDAMVEAFTTTTGGIMAQLDDLMAAVAADTAATQTAVDLINGLQDQVTALQASVADLQAQIDANQPVDLTAITAQVQGLADSLTAAEEPNA